MKSKFREFACRVADLTGSPSAFGWALISILVWLLSGPAFHYSDTWQLIVNTATTVITFLMVFLIQHAQNRDTRAMQLKLNALLLGVKNARNEFVEAENMSDEEIEQFKHEFHEIYLKFHGVSELRKTEAKKARR